MTEPANNQSPPWLMPANAVAALALALGWAYWPTFRNMSERWSTNAQYSHGWLVPLFALGLLYARRDMFLMTWSPRNWWGAALIACALAIRWAGALVNFHWLDGFSLLPLLAGVAFLVGGKPLLAWSWPSIFFLLFMIPLPYRIEMALGNPLRHLATVSSTYVLQSLGLPALAQGNVIHIQEAKMGVVEACSGLSMLMVFVALAVAVVFLIRRPLWEKAVLLASAVPIALLANVARITVTGVLHVTVSSAFAEAFFHDFAGWLMMPLALVLLWVELKYLAWLLVTPAPFLARNGALAPAVSNAGPA